MTQVEADDKKANKKDAKDRGSGQIWAAVITALATIVVGLITLYGTLRVTDSRIVTGPEIPGPTVTRTITVAPTATVTETVDPNGGGGDGDSTSSADAETALDVTWKTGISEWSGDIGHKVLFDCPPRGIPQLIWGDQLYFGNSSVCTAAVHDGRISLVKGGRVTVEVREGSSSYLGTRRNGITSKKRSGFSSSSFEFLPPRNN